jgi:hypothetical protein
VNRIIRAVSLLAVGSFLAMACQKEGVKAGDPCNGPGSCKAPLTCVETDKGSFCGGSCEFDMGNYSCKDPALAPSKVSANGLAAGCYCLPK